MKKIFIVAISFLSLLKGYSQNFNIQLQESPVFRMSTARVQNDYILPDNKGGFVTISTKRSGFLANPLVTESYATLYNSNLEQVKSAKFRMNKGAVKATIKGAFIRKDSLHLLEMESNLRKRYYAFKSLTGNINSDQQFTEKEFFRLDFIYPKTEVNLFVNLNSLYYEKLKYYSDVNFFTPKIYIKFSKNNRFFSIVNKTLDEQHTTYEIHVFNHRFEKVFDAQISESVPNKLFKINDIAIDDHNGKVYITAAVLKTDPEKKKRIINTDNLEQFKIYEVSNKTVHTYPFKPGKVTEQIHIALPGQATNEVYIYGFYRHKYLDLNDIDGIFRLNLSKNGLALLDLNYADFSEKLVKTAYKKSHKKTKNHQMIIRKTYLFDNGDLLINAEDLYVPLLMKKREREENVREIAGDIFSIKLSKNGQVYWNKKIFKEQLVKPRLALHSYFSTLINGNNYILFTDSPLEKQSKEDPFYLKKKDLQNLNGVKISPNGNAVAGLVKENKKSKFRFMPIEGIMIDKTHAIIPAKDHQYIKFFKLDFK